MATLEQLNEWKARLQEARFSGARRVRDQNGEEVEYRSDRELATALAYVDSLIAGVAKPSPSIIRFSTSKGL